MPVISPWVFYAADVAQGVTAICRILGVPLGIAWMILKGLAILSLYDYREKDEDYKTANLIAKKIGGVALALVLLSVFIPGKSTITKMIVAENVTYERVGEVTDVVQTVYEDIMSLFEEEKNE